ncbi:MAG: hypothetical protein WCJ64_04740 [Rhodospirillaceae bacterium]
MIQLSPEVMTYALDAQITAYVWRCRLALTADEVLDRVRRRFGGQPSWDLERVAELLYVRTASRMPKPRTPAQMKGADGEMKDFIRSFAASGEQAKIVHKAVVSRFGADRTPSLGTVTHLLAETRRSAGLPPKRAGAGSKRRKARRRTSVKR